MLRTLPGGLESNVSVGLNTSNTKGALMSQAGRQQIGFFQTPHTIEFKRLVDIKQIHCLPNNPSGKGRCIKVVTVPGAVPVFNAPTPNPYSVLQMTSHRAYTFSDQRGETQR
jgi:hypothetical protein